MSSGKNNWIQAVVLGALIVLTLPLTYYLVAKVMLPMGWDEPQYSTVSGSAESE